MSDNEVEVSYSVKELIKQLSDRIDAFMSVMGTKADQASVSHAHERIDRVEDRVGSLEYSFQAKEKHSAARQEFRRWIIPALLTAGTIGVMLFQALHG